MQRTSFHRSLLVGVLGAASIVMAGCSRGVEGVYENPTGAMVIEFRDGFAHMTTGMVTDSAAYEERGDQIVLDVDGEDLVLTRNDDGSLSSPFGTFRKR